MKIYNFGKDMGQEIKVFDSKNLVSDSEQKRPGKIVFGSSSRAEPFRAAAFDSAIGQNSGTEHDQAEEELSRIVRSDDI